MELGISPACLSLLVNGNRKCKDDMKERYEEFGNTVANSANRAGDSNNDAYEWTRTPTPDDVSSSLSFVQQGFSTSILVRSHTK